MSKWYSVEAKADRAVVYLYDEIGKKGVGAKDFADEFNAITASHVDLYIESMGGSVLQGTAIKSTIAKHPAHVTAHIDSIAGSITSDIILACDEIHIADDAFVMIHNPSAKVSGDADDLRQEAKVLDKMTDAMAEAYAARMNISADDARALMKAETWYRGQEAVDAGYADATYSGRQLVAHLDPARFTASAPAEAVKRFTQSPSGGNYQPSATSQKGCDPMSDATTTTETEPQASVEPQVDETVETTSEELATAEAPEVSVEEAVQQALADERERTAEITTLGGKFGFAEDAETHIASGKSVEDFRAHILGKSPDDWKASLQVRNPAQQDMSDEDDNDSASNAVAKIKERRQARYGT